MEGRVPYERRRPEYTVLYQVVQGHFETFLAQVELETGSRPALIRQRRIQCLSRTYRMAPGAADELARPFLHKKRRLRCSVNEHGFSLHAEVRCAALSRSSLLALARPRRQNAQKHSASGRGRARKCSDSSPRTRMLDNSRAQQYPNSDEKGRLKSLSLADYRGIKGNQGGVQCK